LLCEKKTIPLHHRNKNDMSKKKKKNKGKKKSSTCPTKTQKIKFKKGDLTQIEMYDLCNKIQISKNHIVLC
jgi:hypothetical protein